MVTRVYHISYISLLKWKTYSSSCTILKFETFLQHYDLKESIE